MPTLELLYHPEKRENFIDREALEEIARLVESKLADYKIQAQVVDIFPGPVITRFELDLAPGVKVSRISSLSMDLAVHSRRWLCVSWKLSPVNLCGA